MSEETSASRVRAYLSARATMSGNSTDTIHTVGIVAGNFPLNIADLEELSSPLREAAPASIEGELADAFNDTLTHLIVLACMVETNNLPPNLSGFQNHIDKARAVLAKYRGTK